MFSGSSVGEVDVEMATATEFVIVGRTDTVGEAMDCDDGTIVSILLVKSDVVSDDVVEEARRDDVVEGRASLEKVRRQSGGYICRRYLAGAHGVIDVSEYLKSITDGLKSKLLWT